MKLALLPQLLMAQRRDAVEAKIVLNDTTGRTIRFLIRFRGTESASIDWGDGSPLVPIPYTTGDVYVSHAYPINGPYTIYLYNVKGFGFRPLDGQSQYAYDNALISVVDHSGKMEDIPSGAFKRATKLERLITPAVRWVGQRVCAYCSSLREVRLGDVTIHYDGSFQYCPALEKFETRTTGTCWSYVWQGCTKLTTLDLGTVKQFATQDFANCPNLMDITIADKTIDQVRQTAPEGNIIAGYGARFPWSAPATCRFHCTDGIILANGTIIERKE